MNPLTNVKNITKLNETELASGLIHKKSWHDMYKESAWIFIGGLQYDLTEGDILAVFSQYGEIVNINLVRDKKSGKSKGFCFLCYSNQKSTVLAVDNFNGIKLCNRTIRVDHVANYKPPKENEKDDEITRTLKSEGCAPKVKLTSDTSDAQLQIKKKKSKKVKKEKKKKKRENSFDRNVSIEDTSNIEIKKEKHDPGYDKYEMYSDKSGATKVKHRERSLEKSKGESSHILENYRSRTDKQYTTTRERDSIENKKYFVDGNGLLKTNMQERDFTQHKNSHRDNMKYTSSSKSHKRERSSSSSDDSSSNRVNKIKHKSERDQTKNRHSESKRKYKEDVSSSSSSSDDSSSTQSSSDNERKKDKSRYSMKVNYKTSVEKMVYQDERAYKYRESRDSSYTSSKSRHYDKSEKYSEHRSRSKHRSDDSDNTDHKNFHKNKRKHDKR